MGYIPILVCAPMLFWGGPLKPNAGLCLRAAEAVALKQRFDVLLRSRLRLTDDQGQAQKGVNLDKIS